MDNTTLLGKLHYEVIERNGYRETLIGRYATQEEAEKNRDSRLIAYECHHLAHGVLIVRRREF